MRQATKLVFVLLALVAALALGACGGSEDSSTTTGATGSGKEAEAKGAGGKEAGGEEAVPTIVIRNGEPVGGVKQLEYSAGEQIRFKVKSDIAEEVHFHGYEVMKDVEAGGTVSFDLAAEIEGIFEVELEGEKEQIAEIQVNP
jgi:hypothetical protein